MTPRVAEEKSGGHDQAVFGSGKIVCRDLAQAARKSYDEHRPAHLQEIG